MSKILLSKIKHLTFYHDEVTAARRTDPIPQLQCIGKPCRTFQPEVVRCTNAGGSETEVEWTCQADLPDSLRFGKVEVSCEGWKQPGDPYVLKGSCSLEYRLIEVPGSYRQTRSYTGGETDTISVIFGVVWIAVLAWILWGLIKSFLNAGNLVQRPNGNRPGFGGYFPGGNDDDPATYPPPPPYQKDPPTQSQGQGWRPGFWSGAALGGLGAHAYNSYNRPRTQPVPPRRGWDWDNLFRRNPGRPRPSLYDDLDNHGEGSSSGTLRSSTGLGSSRVR